MSSGHRCEATAPTETAVERWHGFAVTEGEKGQMYEKCNFFSPSVSLRSTAPSSEEAKLHPQLFINTKILTIILFCPVFANAVVYKKSQKAYNHRHAENDSGKLIPANTERAPADS